MQDTTITIASLRSVLRNPRENLERVEKACGIARRAGARLIVLPELMLTGHGGHPKMTEHAQPVPAGPLSQAVLEMSQKYSLCNCVGLAELSRGIVYNSQMVADKGKYLGLQRRINLLHLKLHELYRLLKAEPAQAFLVLGDGHAIPDLSREAIKKKFFPEGREGNEEDMALDDGVAYCLLRGRTYLRRIQRRGKPDLSVLVRRFKHNGTGQRE